MEALPQAVRQGTADKVREQGRQRRRAHRLPTRQGVVATGRVAGANEFGWGLGWASGTMLSRPALTGRTHDAHDRPRKHGTQQPHSLLTPSGAPESCAALRDAAPLLDVLSLLSSRHLPGSSTSTAWPSVRPAARAAIASLPVNASHAGG